MKTRGIEPVWMSILGTLIAPLACGINAVLASLALGEKSSGVLIVFFGATSGTLLLCFPLGLVSERIINIWYSGQVSKSRRLSALCGVGALFCLLSIAPTVGVPPVAYIYFAALLIPFLWSLLFLVFAVFARPAKP